MTCAAAVIIGNEILSGRVRDENAAHLALFLRGLGIELARVVFIADDLEDIAHTVRECATTHDHVFTSGGIGPTHDDCTIAGIARGFDCPLVRQPELVAMLRGHYGAALTDAALKMGDVPEGARVLFHKPYPTIIFRNIYILPGIPTFFAAQLEQLRDEFAGEPWSAQRIYLDADEVHLAATLAAVSAQFPQVSIGSYPHDGERDYRVLVTVEARDPNLVAQATALVLSRVPPAQVVRIDPQESSPPLTRQGVC